MMGRYVSGIVLIAMLVFMPLAEVSLLCGYSEESLKREVEEELVAEAELAGRIVCSDNVRYEVVRTVYVRADEEQAGLMNSDSPEVNGFVRRTVVITDREIREEATENGCFSLLDSDRVRANLCG